MNRITRNLSIIYRTERLIARRELEVWRSRTGLAAGAGVAAGIGLVMLNVAGFLALRDLISEPGAALCVALANFLLAWILVTVAGRLNHEREVASATEVRDLAIADLEAEIEEATREVGEVAQGLKAMARDPLTTGLPALLVPLLKMLLSKKEN